MSAPTNPKDAKPTATDANKLADVDKTETETNENEARYVVRCPGSMSVLKGEDFPDVTPDGTEMKESEMKAAKAAAAVVFVKLSTTKVKKEGAE